MPAWPYRRLPARRETTVGPVLEISLTQVTYPHTAIPALQQVAFCALAGSWVALVGPNGSGKSTLLKAIAGLLPVNAGEIRVFGQPPGSLPARVAYLPQRSEIDWRFPINVAGLVLTGRYVHLGWLQGAGQADRERMRAALAQVELAGLADRQISQLSGGQQQRALLARALTQEADLLLLDEPFNAVDADTRSLLSRALTNLQRAGKTIVCATHDEQHVKATASAIVQLEAGRQITQPLPTEWASIGSAHAMVSRSV